MKSIKIAPSILSADLLKLKEQIKIVEQNGADLIHVDIMDGHFVPNITFGPVIVKTLKRITKLPLDVHLMISNPDNYAPHFIDAGGDYITIHQESSKDLKKSIQYVKDLKAKVGVSVNPSTEISTILPVLSELYLVLLMTVNPGFGAQKFINSVTEKVKKISDIKEKNGYSFLIEVDGGINLNTVPTVVEAGAEVLVAGNAIFGQNDIANACRELKKVAEETVVKK